jgi:hypothetical protein
MSYKLQKVTSTNSVQVTWAEHVWHATISNDKLACEAHMDCGYWHIRTLPPSAGLRQFVSRSGPSTVIRYGVRPLLNWVV